jgi:hypothetical protein
MKEEKIKTTAELLAERKWTKFLKKIPVGTTDWRIADYRDFVSLRSVACMLGKKEDYDRTFTITQRRDDKTIYDITVELKNGTE